MTANDPKRTATMNNWIRLAIIGLMYPLQVMALDSNEFHLYGRAKDGTVFDITPSGTTSGDPEEAGGIHGPFLRWRSGTSLPDQIGMCRVENRRPYTFRCEAGPGPFGGVEYEGEEVTSASIKSNAELSALRKRWLRSKEYGDPTAAYRCKSGCTDALPRTLIFIWYGD